MENICKSHTHCRACNSDKLTKYLDLGKMPLANNLEDTYSEAMEAKRFPLEIMLCENCGLSQLSVVIDPETLFAYYTYRSSVNQGYIDHCQKMAKYLKKEYGLDEASFIVDVAGNDGTLLKEFKDVIGCDVLNIDPAFNLTTICENRGIPAWNVFWKYEIAKAIQGQVDVITATNVFAHVDDIQDFLKASKLALKPNGILVIECPYVVDHIKKLEFTQTYFEHLSYMSVTPIFDLCNRLGLRLIDVQHQDIHGGSIRMIITNENALHEPKNGVQDFLIDEEVGGYNDIEIYQNWAGKVQIAIEKLEYRIYELKDGAIIAGFGASAKGNTLLNTSKIYPNLDFIIDETPEKIGKFSPGTGLKIVGMWDGLIEEPDYIIILSWNFKDEIMAKLRKNGYEGKFIIPIPSIEII